MVLRNRGVILFKSRWDQGSLTFKGEKLMWSDALNEAKNVMIPGSALKEQQLGCLKPAEIDSECFEWGIRTATAEYRFRDVAWERSSSKKSQEIFDFFKSIYPNLSSTKVQLQKN
ncbi:MAG: hypothetical protein DIJKHBIC_04086 [Thermoanaerobaculia bacterium]|nr:hypothetical protein [Thermoanaerobaculia bacterium]